MLTRRPLLAVPCVLLLQAAASAHAAAIYWTDSTLETITRSALDGTAMETVVPAGLDYPEGIVLLPDREEMWWADGGLGAILRADLDGGGIDNVVTGLSAPAGLAVDTRNGKVYWSNVAVGTIHRANLDGSGVEQFLPAVGHVRNLAVDPDGGRLYFSGEGNTKVQRANLDGTDVEDLATASNPLGIALDVAAGKVYWVGDGIRRANLDGSEPELLLTASASGLALDTVGGKIYWTVLASPYLRRADLDGSDVEDLVVAGPATPRALALLLPTATGAPSASGGPGASRLGPPSPHPLRSATSLAWRANGAVSIRVIDVSGRLVRQLLERGGADDSAGIVQWDGTDRSGRTARAGVYFVELRDGQRRASQKVVVAR